MTTLLVASSGGHLDELLIMAAQLDVDARDAVWVTSRTPQTTSLLDGREVFWVDHVGSADYRKAVMALPAAIGLHRKVRPDLVVSTGALQAVPHLLAASMARCETWYVESVTRLHGPSKTGRLAGRLPGVRRFAQGKGWNDPRWSLVPDVFEGFEAVPRGDLGTPAPIRSAVVALGTEKYDFSRAVRRAAALLEDAEVVWQTGSTVAFQGGVQLQQWMPADQLREACAKADLIITHAGVGSALTALSEGKVPVILPRRAAHGEHVDDHQLEIAGLLAERNLAVCVDADELTAEHLRRAAGLRARRRDLG